MITIFLPGNLFNDMKQANDTLYIPFEKAIVDAVDSIIKLANKNGSNGFIKTSKDWETIAYIFKVWETLYPKEYKKFMQSIDYFRQYEDSNIAKEKTAMLGHKGEIPQHLHQMIKVIFPIQNWDKPFFKGLFKELPQLQV